MKKIIFIIGFAMILFVGCSDNTTGPASGNGSLKMYLVDSPSSFDSVIIFVKRVEVHKSGSDSTSGWYVINNTLRSFDLLQLRNGASAVLGDSILSPGNYTQIRLILDDGNYVIDNGIKHDLRVPSGFQTGIKLNQAFTIEPNSLYELILDFNVDKSIHITGNGQYMLKPVIRCMSMVTSGTISGQVLPLDAQAVVFTTIGSDTVTTYPDTLGFFKLMALPEGLYDVEIGPLNPVYKDTVITGVNVLANQISDIGTIVLQQN
ncbi:MAG: DUF4382 domain-containing protein [Ignavibacterium sp.]|nr:DUF4382 domain-containing protein [Ignavibacterium sp.]